MLSQKRSAGTIIFLALHEPNREPSVCPEGAAECPSCRMATEIGKMWRNTLLFCPTGKSHSNPILDFVRSFWPKREVWNGMTVVYPPALRIPGRAGTAAVLFLSPLFFALYARLGRIKVAGVYAATIYVALSCLLLKRNLATQAVVTYSDPDYLRVKGATKLLTSVIENVSLGRIADTVVWRYPVVRDHLKRRFGNKRRVFIPPGGTGGKDRGTSNLPPVAGDATSKELSIVYAGRIDRSLYRLDALLNAAPEIVLRYPAARFVIIGDGKSRDWLISEVESRHLEGSFRFRERVKYEELDEYVSNAAVALQLSRDVCGGSKVVKYMKLGLPIVISCAECQLSNPLLKSGNNCILVQPKSSQLAEAILRLLGDSELRRRIGGNALRTIAPYTWRSHAQLVMESLQLAPPA